MERNIRVVITGGHHTPALAVVRSFQKMGVVDIIWVGHKTSMWGDRSLSAEYRTVAAAGIPFYDLKTGKVYHIFNPLRLLRLPFGFLQALFYLVKIRPDLIVSFGGYLAVPVVFWGFVLGIPTVTHEQTTVAGLANRVIALFAKRIFITWPKSFSFFPKSKVVVTGNPLRRELFRATSGAKLKEQISLDRRVVYLTGGKQGSHLLNKVIEEALPELLKRYTVVHQCGSSSVFNDRERLYKLRDVLPRDQKPFYLVKDYFGEEEIGEVFTLADVVVSRAGANIVYELAALGKPAILIPIPWVSHNEQEENARILVDLGAALVLKESDLSPETLLSSLQAVFAELGNFQSKAREAKSLVKFDAADNIAKLALKEVLLPKEKSDSLS